MDPQLTNDGKPYGPIRYKELVKERYYITKNLNTSYTESGQLTPLERKYLLEFIIEENKKTKEMIEEKKNQSSR